jgi:hypothetical protein
VVSTIFEVETEWIRTIEATSVQHSIPNEGKVILDRIPSLHWVLVRIEFDA